MNIASVQKSGEAVREMRLLPLGGAALSAPLAHMRGDRSGLATIVIVGAPGPLLTLGQMKQVVRILKGEIADPGLLELSNFAATSNPGAGLRGVDAVLIEPATNHEIVYRGVFRHRAEVLRDIRLLEGISKELGELAGAWWREGILKCDDEARTRAAMEIVKRLPATLAERERIISLFCETHGKFADVRKGLAELLDILPAPAGIVSSWRYRPDGAAVSWPRNFGKELGEAATEIGAPYLDTRPIILEAGLDQALKQDMVNYQPDFRPVIGKKLAAFALSFARPRRRVTRPEMISAVPVAAVDQMLPTPPQPAAALSVDMHILTFGSSLLLGPLSRVAPESTPNRRHSFAGPAFNILTLGEMRQMCRFMSGDLVIDESMRDLCDIPHDFVPPDLGGALNGVNVALVEPNTSYEFTYGGYCISRYGLFRFLAPIKATDRKLNGLVGSWLQAGVLTGDTEAQEKFAREIASNLPFDTPHFDRVRSVLYETRGKISDLETDLADLTRLLGVPVGVVSFTWRYMKDGRALSWPAKFHSDMKEATRKLGLNYFDSQPLVAAAGVDNALASDLRRYSNNFKGVVGQALIEFASGFAAPQSSADMAARSTVRLIDDDADDI